MDVSSVTEDAGLLRQPTYEPSSSPIIPSPKPRKSFVYDTEFPVISDENPTVLSPEDIPDEYMKPGTEAGLLIIFNHRQFRELKLRQGTEKDVQNLIDCFSRLRYEVRMDMVFHDLPKIEVVQKLKEIAQLDHKERNSLIIIFLTHGDTDGKLHCSDDLCLTSEEIWMSFSPTNCPTMFGKPKIFIFQACKGSNKSKIAGIEEDSIRMTAAKEAYTLPEEADILVAYSTLEGNVSYRHIDNGSWYIQELCKNLTAYARREDILSILTRVAKCVAHHYTHASYKQMPCILSTLTSKFYLCQSKERELFLHIVEHQRQLARRMENVEKALQALQRQQKDDNNDKKLVKATEKQNKKNLSSMKSSKKPVWRC